MEQTASPFSTVCNQYRIRMRIYLRNTMKIQREPKINNTSIGFVFILFRHIKIDYCRPNVLVCKKTAQPIYNFCMYVH